MKKKLKRVDEHIQTKKTNYSAVGCPYITTTNLKTGVSVSPVHTTNTTKFVVFKKTSPIQQNARRDWKRFYRPQRIMYRFIGKAYRVKYDECVFYFNFHKSHPTFLYHKTEKLEYFKNKGFRLTFNKSPKSSHYFRRYIKNVRARNVFNARGM